MPETTVDTIADQHRGLLQQLASDRFRKRAFGILRRPWRPVARRVFPHLYADEEASYKAALKMPSDVMARLERLPGGFITGYSLKPDTAAWLHTFVAGRSIEGVIELGCGVSTLVIGLALNQPGRARRFLSLEGEEGWLAKTDDALRKVGIRDQVDLRFGPLEKREFRGTAYQIHRLDSGEDMRADLLFVDAPPREVGRVGALFRFHPMLKDGAYVILDDAQREGELQVVQQWVASGLAQFDRFVPVGCGLAVLRVLKRENTGGAS